MSDTTNATALQLLDDWIKAAGEDPHGIDRDWLVRDLRSIRGRLRLPLAGQLVTAEFQRANSVHAPMASAHEGYAVILEELDELWDEVKKGGTEPRDLKRMRKEAVQVGAMALRFLHDVCGVTGE